MVKISAEARFDSPFLSGASRTRFLLVTLQAPQQEGAQPAAPLNLGLVIDASGSMAGSKLAAAREASVLVGQQLTEKDRLSIVSFSSDTQIHVDGRMQDAQGRMDASTQISGLCTRSNTNLSDGYFAGAECVARGLADGWQGRSSVVLLSDGMANEGITNHAELERHARELWIRGVTTSAVGIGNGYQPLLLEGMAEHGGGRLHDAEVPEEIAQVVLGELQDLSRQVADSITVELNLPPGTECECLGDFPTQQTAEGFMTRTGGLLAGRSRELIYKLKFSPTLAGAAGAQVNIRWRGEGESHGCIELPAIQLTDTPSDLQARAERSPQLALRVAERWKLSIIRQVTVRKYSRRMHDMVRWLDQEQAEFISYCSGLPGADVHLRELRNLQTASEVEWDGRTSMDLLNFTKKSMRQDIDHRRRPSKSLDEMFPKSNYFDLPPGD